MRISKSNVQKIFKVFVKLYGDDTLELDYAPIYGGYRVVKIGKDGEEYHLFGSQRRNAMEMYLSLSFAIDVLTDQKIKENSK